MSESNKSVVLPTFSGKDEAFQLWWTKFRAFATTKGCIKALLGKEGDLPNKEDATLDETVPEQKKRIDARSRNSLAMAYLLSAFKAEADVSLAYETMDDNWPGGLAYKVVEKLKEVYQPKDNITEVDLYEKLMAVKMKKKEDPKKLFEKIASIQNWYNEGTKKIPKEQLIAVVLKAAPLAYASVLTSEQEKRGNGLELTHLRVVMKKYYRAVYQKTAVQGDDDDDDEMALTGQDGKNNANRNKKKFKGKCHNCGKEGHMARDCWKDPKNAEKRPAWYKGEVSATSTDSKKSNELQLVNVSWGKYAEAFAEEDDINFEEPMSYLQAAQKAVSDSEDEDDDDIYKDMPALVMRNEWNDDPDSDSDDEDHFTKVERPRKKKRSTKENCKNKQSTKKNSGKEQSTKKIYEFIETKLDMTRTIDDMSVLEDPDVTVLDTGATCHSTGNSKGMIDFTSAKGSTTKMGNGAKVATKAIGKIPFRTGDGTEGVIHGVHLIPGAPFTLISGTKLLTLGYKVSGDHNGMTFTKGDHKLKFNMKVKSPDGMLLCARLTRTANEVGGVASTAPNKPTKTVSIQRAHEELGHMDEEATRKAAKQLGWTITRGTLGKCESCAKGKAKQKKVRIEEPKEKSSTVNGRVYLDLSRIVSSKAKAQPRRPNWTIIVDEKTGYKSSMFKETKDGMIEPTCQKLHNWKQQGMEVKTIRMDNGGENKGLVKRLNSKAWKLYPTIEYTARDTPQHNHLAEVGFATIYGRGRSMMIKALVPEEKKHIVAQKAFETATKLDGLIPVNIDGQLKPRVEHWCGKIPAFAKHLRIWGEAGTVKTKTKTTPKLKDRGITCMFVGYAGQHAGDCYEMLNWETKRIIETRDVTWLNRMYFEKGGMFVFGEEWRIMRSKRFGILMEGFWINNLGKLMIK